jgi:hypothetical protein
MNAATTSGRAETIGGDPVELEIAGGEIAALSKNLDRGQTPRKRSCVREDDRAAVDGVHRVEIVASVNRDGVESEEPIVEALGAYSASATVSRKTAPASAEDLVGYDISLASGDIDAAIAGSAERIEVHQEPRNVAAVCHEQVALRVHGEAGGLHKAYVARSPRATVRSEATAAGPENEVRRLADQR